MSILGADRVDWTLVDEHAQTVCRYTAHVLHDAKILLELPRSYGLKLKSEEWKLFMYPTENTD